MSDEQLPLPTPSQEVRQWAMFCHLSALLGIWIPFGTIIGPLILWQIKREMDPFIDAQGKEALNFQITVAIASAICFLLMLVNYRVLPVWPDRDRCAGANDHCRGEGQ